VEMLHNNLTRVLKAHDTDGLVLIQNIYIYLFLYITVDSKKLSTVFWCWFCWKDYTSLYHYL